MSLNQLQDVFKNYMKAGFHCWQIMNLNRSLACSVWSLCDQPDVHKAGKPSLCKLRWQQANANIGCCNRGWCLCDIMWTWQLTGWLPRCYEASSALEEFEEQHQKAEWRNGAHREGEKGREWDTFYFIVQHNFLQACALCLSADP